MRVCRGFVELPLHEHPTALEDVHMFVQHSGGWASPECPFSAVVCLGGSMGAYEDDKHSWMPLEKQVRVCCCCSLLLLLHAGPLQALGVCFAVANTSPDHRPFALWL